jgi:hypothetical protein
MEKSSCNINLRQQMCSYRQAMSLKEEDNVSSTYYATTERCLKCSGKWNYRITTGVVSVIHRMKLYEAALVEKIKIFQVLN